MSRGWNTHNPSQYHRRQPMSEDRTYVYMISISESYIVKVGIAQNPQERLSTLQIGNPYNLILETQTNSMYSREHAIQIESYIHKKLEELGGHMRGEWYHLDAKIFDETIGFITKAEDYPEEK